MSEDVVTVSLGPFDAHGVTRARFQGRWIEIEHGIPGETVEAEIFGGRRKRGRILQVLDPSPDRVEPPCPYFREWHCGGCQWQQIDYSAQLRYKSAHIEAAMQVENLPYTVTAVHALDDPWRYRATAGISLGRNAGFRRHASLAIVPLHDCLISHPLIGRLMGELNDRIDGGMIPDLRGRVRLDVRLAGEWENATLQILVRRTDATKPVPSEDIHRLVEVLATFPEVSGIAVQEHTRIRLVKGELLAPMQIAGQPVWLAAASFFQTNPRLLPRLIGRMEQEAAPLTGKRIADVYGGVGVFGLFLAAGGAEVTEIESDPVAVDAGRRTAEEWGLETIQFVASRAEDALSAGYDVVIVDPPRPGLSEPVLHTLIETKPPLVLYVSCLPESLARDLVPLSAAGYRVEHLELFDFYPQTYHIESFCVLRHA